jgi:hypothetical protein
VGDDTPRLADPAGVVLAMAFRLVVHPLPEFLIDRPITVFVHSRICS